MTALERARECLIGLWAEALPAENEEARGLLPALPRPTVGASIASMDYAGKQSEGRSAAERHFRRAPIRDAPLRPQRGGDPRQFSAYQSTRNYAQ